MFEQTSGKAWRILQDLYNILFEVAHSTNRRRLEEMVHYPPCLHKKSVDIFFSVEEEYSLLTSIIFL